MIVTMNSSADGSRVMAQRDPLKSNRGRLPLLRLGWPGHSARRPGEGGRRPPPMTLSIRTRLMLLVLAVLLPGMVAALWVAWQAWQDGSDLLVRHMRDNARALSMVVDRELAQRATIARVLSLSRMLDSAPEVDPGQLLLLEAQARRAMQGLDGWVTLNTQEFEMFSTRDQPRPGGPLRLMRPRPPGSPPLLDRPMIGGLESDPTGGPMRAAIVQPVERGGRTLANFLVTILPQELQQIIDHQGLPADWTAAVVDGRGTVVARSPGGLRHSGRSISPQLAAMMQRYDEALFQGENLDGQPVMAYFSTSPQGWTFIITVPRELLSGGQMRALTPVLMGALVLLMLGLAGALWVGLRITRPLDDLTSMAQALQSGRQVQSQPTGIDECDHVARALASASDSVHRARIELEQRVNDAVERTREAEQLSSRSQRIAALGRLTGGVAHDFNNLLGVISNSAHLIQRHTSNETLQVPIGAILRSVEVGSRLTQHLLRFAGRQPVRPQALDLVSTLQDLRELLTTVLGKRVELTLELQPATRMVTVDPAELELALINIALNARDAINGTGRVRIEVRDALAHETEGLARGDYALIAVTDNGPGIPEDMLPRVFEPFFTSKPMGKATGLGLSQVMGFCVQAGGSARIASPPGGGTTVTLLLPARGSAAGPTPAASAPDLSALAGVRVLLVEDNEDLSRVTATLLRSFSCQVICAYDADDALRRFGTGAGIDVVLSDVMMPGAMDGATLVRALRALRPGLPAVLISGYSAALTDEPSFIVLRKPCSPAQLLDGLRRAMAGQGPVPAPTPRPARGADT